jgi:VWFA-related protein
MRTYCLKVFLLAFFTLAATLTTLAQGQAQNQTPAQQKQDQQKPDKPIKISSTYVTVPVIVTDRYGRLVTGLSKENFTVREDGKAQRVEDFSASETPFNVVLLIDTSRSTVRKLGAIQKAAENFIKQLQPRDRVMVVTFDDRINVISDFTGDVSTLKKAIKSARTGYSTRLYDAINFAINDKLASVTGRKAIVVLTDGVDTASKEATFDSTFSLIAGSGVISYAIQYETRNEGAPVLRPLNLPGVPNGASLLTPKFNFTRFGFSATPLQYAPALSAAHFLMSTQSGVLNHQQPAPQKDRYLVASEFLRAIATVSGARHLRANSIENTSFAFELIANELRNLYTLGYYSSNDQRDGRYRQIGVSVNPNSLSVRTRDGYRAPQEETEDEAAEPKDKKPTPPVKP